MVVPSPSLQELINRRIKVDPDESCRSTAPPHPPHPLTHTHTPAPRTFDSWTLPFTACFPLPEMSLIFIQGKAGSSSELKQSGVKRFFFYIHTEKYPSSVSESEGRKIQEFMTNVATFISVL